MAVYTYTHIHVLHEFARATRPTTLETLTEERALGQSFRQSQRKRETEDPQRASEMRAAGGAARGPTDIRFHIPHEFRAVSEVFRDLPSPGPTVRESMPGERIDADSIKTATGQFDLESVFKLTMSHMGIRTIENLSLCPNLTVCRC